METFASLSNRALLRRMKQLVEQERRRLPDLLACLAEIDRRKVYADEGYSSLFVYCLKELRYSDGAAARRIHAARAASRYPEIYVLLSEGALALSAVSLLAPYLTPGNRDSMLQEAQGKSKRDLERMIAAIAPKPDITDRMRRLPPEPPAPKVEAQSEPAARAAELWQMPVFAQEKVRPSAPQRVQFSFTGSEELLEKIERAKDLLRHKFPAGRLEAVLLEIVDDFLERRDPERRLARTGKGRTPSLF